MLLAKPITWQSYINKHRQQWQHASSSPKPLCTHLYKLVSANVWGMTQSLGCWQPPTTQQHKGQARIGVHKQTTTEESRQNNESVRVYVRQQAAKQEWIRSSFFPSHSRVSVWRYNTCLAATRGNLQWYYGYQLSIAILTWLGLFHSCGKTASCYCAILGHTTL